MEKKNVIIFGSNGGLGKEILSGLLKLDVDFYLSVKNKQGKIDLLKNFNSIEKKKIKFLEVCDFSNFKSIDIFFKKLKKKVKKIHLSFNCIGHFDYDDIKKINHDKLLLTFQLNLFSNILITKNLIKFSNKKEILKIFHIGSTSSYEGFENTTYYCAAKHGLVGAIKSMNKETNKYNVINYLISMGSMKTKMGKKIKNQNYESFLETKKISEFIIHLAFLEFDGYAEQVLIKRLIK